MDTISITLTLSQQEQLVQAYPKQITYNPIPYSKWQIHLEDCVITCYTSNKTVFQGDGAKFYSAQFQTNVGIFPQAGSDEVGTGDYFGPVCVCASIVDEKSATYLNQFEITDSKKMNDEKILEVAPLIMSTIPYSLLVVDNMTYNRIHKNNNLNQMKAKLHNQAYVHLSKKQQLPSLIVVDQFAPKDLYFQYIKKEPKIIYNIHFETKAESKYLAVACASVISRYAFLQAIQQLSSHFHFQFVKGAGSNVDECAKQFVKQFGMDKLQQVAKIHFKNTEKIKLGE